MSDKKVLYIRTNVFLKDAPQDVQKTLRELGIDESLDIGKSFAEFLKSKGEDVKMIDRYDVVIEEKQELKPCPFCGEIPIVKTKELWNGSHGYHGCYEVSVSCQNCGCKKDGTTDNTIYKTYEEARRNVIAAWNRRLQ